MKTRLVALVACCAFVFAHTAMAQETINQGSISGRITDPSGAVVPGAQITARQTETNVTAETVTDAEGRFRFPYLRVGPYEVKVRLQGFTEATRVLTLTAGSAFELPFSLTVGALDANVTVTAEETVIETARSQISNTVSQTEVNDVPLNGRNFLDLALLVPGVSPTNTGSTQLFAETSAVPGQGLSIGSQRNFSNNFIVDGLSANDDAAGFSGMPYGVDAVDQFQVVTSGGQAELGRSLGGYINVVTRSGTNTPRGELYGYFRDDAFNARNALSGTKLPMNQKQYGASMGGPIARNRTFFFSNVEQRKLDQTGLATITQQNVDIINTRLAAVNYGGLPVSTGIYENPVHTTNFLGKVDHQLSGSDQLSVRYSLYDVTSSNSRGAGGLNAPSASAALDNIDQAVAFSNTVTLSARTVNETRVQFAYGDLKAPSTDPIGPTVSIAGVATFGTFQSSPTLRVNKMYQVVDNISHQRGAHALRAGIDLLYNDDTISNPGARRGSYAFSSLANFLTGTYNNAGFTQAFGETTVTQGNSNVGFYAQDEWKVGPSVTVNAGLRYDLQLLETINTDSNNVSPRLGFAWSPSALGRTVVRGSAGLFYDRVPLRAVANALLSAGNTTNLDELRRISIGLSPTQDGAPTFPAILSAFVPTVALVNFTTMDPHMRNGYSRQGSVEVERQLGQGTTLSVSYQYLRGANLIMSVNQNVPSCVAVGSNNGCRPNPSYANNSQYSPAASSTYQGLHVSFVQRPTGWGHYRVSYTLSKSMNNVGENFFSSPIDPYDISKDWGRSDDDQRHRFIASGTVDYRGFHLGSMLQAYSALPFNITSGVTTIQGTAGRPIVDGEFIPRNAGIASTFFTLSARLSRAFSIGGSREIEGAVEAFNLTNRRNDLTRNGNFGAGAYPTNPSPTFGQITAVGDPRTLQFAVRVRF
ncbi:MAG: TonB-dependent receptor [Vicinamibacterales bacterium]|nr:TonB-dependent receptor [Vicinamibacterales bacterium]